MTRAAMLLVAVGAALVARWLTQPADPTLADDDLLDAALRPTSFRPARPVPPRLPTTEFASAVDRLLEAS